MMKLYAVLDLKGKDIVSIFPAVSNEAAERSFLMLVTGPQNIFTQFPEDFALYRVCDLDVNGISLNVNVPDSEALREHGFNAGGFSCSEAVKLGSDYDKRYLAMVHADRFPSVEVRADKVPSVVSDAKDDIL